MYCLTYIQNFKSKIRQKQREKVTVYRKIYGLAVLVKINFVDRTEIIR